MNRKLLNASLSSLLGQNGGIDDGRLGRSGLPYVLHSPAQKSVCSSHSAYPMRTGPTGEMF